MLKKLGNIFVLSLLSMIIVFLGAGVTFVHCHHEGTYRIMQNMANDHEDDDCEPLADCMGYETVGISPTVTAQYSYFDFHVYQPLLVIYTELFQLWQQLFATVEHVREIVHHGFSSPPRHYLQLLRTLLI